MNDVEPCARLKSTLKKIAAGHPQSRIHKLLPCNFDPASNRNQGGAIAPLTVQQRVFIGEIGIERADVHAGALGNQIGRHPVKADFIQQDRRRIEQGSTVRLARAWRGFEFNDLAHDVIMLQA